MRSTFVKTSSLIDVKAVLQACTQLILSSTHGRVVSQQTITLE